MSRDGLIGVRLGYRTLLILSLVLLPGGASFAQRLTSSDFVRFEVLKPKFESADYSFATSALLFAVRQSVEGPVSFEFKLPVAYVGKDEVIGTSWEFRPGNPYIGLSWGSAEKPAELGFGLRVPILPNDAQTRVMRVVDIHQFEAFAPDIWDLSVHSVVGGDMDVAQARSALNFWFPLHDDFEIVADYSLTLRRLFASVLVGVQVRGRAGLTGDNLVFGERTMHEAGAIVEFPTQGARPGFLIRTPIEGREIADWIFGISLSVE